MQFYLDRNLKVKISRANLRRFNANRIDFFAHDKLLVRGKIVIHKGKLQLTLYHPVQILR